MKNGVWRCVENCQLWWKYIKISSNHRFHRRNATLTAHRCVHLCPLLRETIMSDFAWRLFRHNTGVGCCSKMPDSTCLSLLLNPRVWGHGVVLFMLWRAVLVSQSNAGRVALLQWVQPALRVPISGTASWEWPEDVVHWVDDEIPHSQEIWAPEYMEG